VQHIALGPTLFSTVFVQHIAHNAATGKSCLQCFINVAVLFTQNWVSTQFSQNKSVGLSPQNPSLVNRPFGEGVPSLNNSPWPPPCITEDPPLVIVIMYFQIKVRKRFIGDILHIVILDFGDNILTLSVKIWCPGLVKRNYGQLVMCKSAYLVNIWTYYALWYKQILVKARDWTRFVKAPIYIIIQLFELIMICDGVYKQFSVIDDGNLLNIDEVKSVMYYICTS